MTPRARRAAGQEVSAALGSEPALVRELRAAGRRRSKALDQADAELERIAKLAARAIDAGASVKEIAELAGVSRVTLYRLLERT